MSEWSREALREALAKAPVPIGSLLLVFFIVKMFLSHATSIEDRFGVIHQNTLNTLSELNRSLGANTVAMQALAVQIQDDSQRSAKDHDEIELDLEELRTGRRPRR